MTDLAYPVPVPDVVATATPPGIFHEEHEVVKHANAISSVRYTGASWFWWPLIVIFLLSAGWAAASPISAVPDEPAHIIKAAAVVRGELVGTQVGDGGPLLAVDVPRYIEHTDQITCFVRHLALTPACSPPIPGDETATVTGLTTAGLYNPIYYAAVGWPTLLMDGFEAVYAMRLVSALLTSVFLATAFSAVSMLPRNKWALLTLSAGVTPMTLFLNGSVNPNSLEYGTTAAIVANLLLLLRRPEGPLPLVHVATVTAAAALLANTKALSLMWLLVAVIAVILLASAQQIKSVVRSRLVWVGATAIAASCGFAIWWVARHDSLSSKSYEGAGLDFGAGIEIMLDKTFLFMRGYIGQFGWLELDAPTGVMAFWTGIAFAAVLGGIVYGRGRHKAAVIFLAVSLLVLPVVLQALTISEQGLVWQGRYILAVFVSCLMVAGIALDDADRLDWPTKAVPALITVIVLGAASQIITFIWVLRRYVTGLALDVGWGDFLGNPQWEPPLGTLPTVAIFCLGSLLGAALLVRHVRSNTGRLMAPEGRLRADSARDVPVWAPNDHAVQGRGQTETALPGGAGYMKTGTL